MSTETLPFKTEERIVSPSDLANEPVEIVKVSVDAKGGVMFIGSLTAEEFSDWNDAKSGGNLEAKKNASAKLIVQSLVAGPKDPTRIGTQDMVPLFRKSRVARTEKLLQAILKLNGINQPTEESVKNA